MTKTGKTEPPDRYALAHHERDKSGARIMPRIVRRKPRRGDVHPLETRRVRGVLRDAPPSYVYGVRSIELRARPGAIGAPYGLYLSDEKRIHLYSCPPSTWVFDDVEPGTGRRLVRFGATVSSDPRAPRRVIVVWADPDDLLGFYVHVLLHELGHHHTHQYRASRPRRATRRRHEGLADLHAEKIVLRYGREHAKRSGD